MHTDFDPTMPTFPCDLVEGVWSKKSSALISWKTEPWGALESTTTFHSQEHTDIILLHL